jgi:threonine/homoserine/homoserine lactone efflux protein
MDATLAFFSILGAIAIGMASPGPSFLFVARLSAESGARAGLAAALGMGFGGGLFAILAIAGLTALLAQAPWLYLGFKIAGGAYLVYLGHRLWRGAREPLPMTAPGTTSRDGATRPLLLAFATQLSNPKTAVVYASVFAALLPAAVPLALALALPLALFLMEWGWYTLLALGFSRPRLRAAYGRAKRVIDRAAGGVMALLGLRLLTGAALQGAAR